MTTPTTLVFDIGNVLLRWDPNFLFARLIPEKEEREHFLREVLPPEWNEEQDRGRGWDVAEAERIVLFPDKAELIRAWRAHWHEMVPHAIERNVAVLQSAKATGIPCYAITNFAEDTFEEAQARFPFLNTFDGIVVSAKEQLLKPDPAIFLLFLNRYAQNASDCLFIDDSAANTAAARKLGFAAIHVKSETDLLSEVRAHGFRL